ncbi:MAG: hypothetical protein A2452_00920 [Candidatus Firestonebacteria bacterium RIFOXYC2_FULL_39_67]|nr:MAG: hypothetical protein A2536_10880 [Candidatus Firestonebacteria bacterium RIFOXYD2_FULL_39_29]OGF54762.1 MAG: hypothetical protein A2452_00920 [Candidatus Firestonebacteria bacterium RIFOXYC2_FULL_39_67]OGF55251.1 MAG: hypothetical protein A2497_02485 [Candidatus Firestonebacteria bacterium RifOxyC12_full_39_7]
MEDKENNRRLKKTTFLFKLGVVLIILSFLKWVIGAYIPFLPYSDKVKLSIVTVLFVFAEIIFWIGVFLVGEETYKKYKRYLNPSNWFKRAAEAVVAEEKRVLSKAADSDFPNKKEGFNGLKGKSVGKKRS